MEYGGIYFLCFVITVLGLGIWDLIDKIHKLEKEIEGLQWRIESDNKKT